MKNEYRFKKTNFFSLIKINLKKKKSQIENDHYRANKYQIIFISFIKMDQRDSLLKMTLNIAERDVCLKGTKIETRKELRSFEASIQLQRDFCKDRPILDFSKPQWIQRFTLLAERWTRREDRCRSMGTRSREERTLLQCARSKPGLANFSTSHASLLDHPLSFSSRSSTRLPLLVNRFPSKLTTTFK